MPYAVQTVTFHIAGLDIGGSIGRLNDETMLKVHRSLAVFIGIA